MHIPTERLGYRVKTFIIHHSPISIFHQTTKTRTLASYKVSVMEICLHCFCTCNTNSAFRSFWENLWNILPLVIAEVLPKLKICNYLTPTYCACRLHSQKVSSIQIMLCYDPLFLHLIIILYKNSKPLSSSLRSLCFN